MECIKYFNIMYIFSAFSQMAIGIIQFLACSKLGSTIATFNLSVSVNTLSIILSCCLNRSSLRRMDKGRHYQFYI